MSAASEEISLADLDSPPLEAYVADLSPGLTPMQAARQLAEEHSVPVFPCRPDKRPYTEHGFIDASMNGEQIEQWWTTRPDALVAVPTGKVSGLLVVDIDPDGLEWYREHAAELTPGRVHRTRRGHHLLYRLPAALEVRNSAGKLAKGIDVRGEGGYIIWWPAHGLEAVGDLDDIAEPPDWLLKQLVIPAGHDREDHDDRGGGHVQAGGRNEYLSREAFRLRKQGTSVEQILIVLRALNRARCEPPLEESELKTIAAGKAAVEKDAEAISERAPRRSPIAWDGLEGREPPPREWIVPHWIPAGHTTLLAGRGGIGKTLIAQHIATAVALGLEYLEPLEPRRVLMWAGEDDEAELWRRQLTIGSHFGQPLSALTERYYLHSYAGDDITLAAPVFGSLQPTPMLAELREQVHDYGVGLVILDNVARIYGASENDRHAVTTMLTWLAGACAPAAVLLLSHPAKDAGSEYSGSTAWEGAVRARLYMSDQPHNQGSEEAAPISDSVRYLARRKANYSALDIRQLSLRDGVLIPAAVEPERRGQPSGEFLRDIVRRAVRTLAERGTYGNASTSSPNYLPRLAKQYGLLDTATPKAFAATMCAMVMDRALVSKVVGQYANRTPREGLAVP